MLSEFVDKHYKWVFAGPALVFMLLMMIVPVVMTLGFSLTDWDLLSGSAPVFNYGHNYLEVLKSSEFWSSCWITFYYTSIATISELIAGLLIAVILNKSFRGRKFVKTVILLPYMMAPVAVGMMWMLFLEPTSGLMNFVFRTLGLPASSFLSSRKSVIPTIAFVEFWQMTPMVIIVCIAGLASLPKDSMEAARIDGASSTQMFFRVMLPMLMPTLFSIGLLRFIDVFKSFDLIYALTKGGPGNASRTLNLFAYEEAFSYYRFGYSSAILTLVLVIVMLISTVTTKIKNKNLENC